MLYTKPKLIECGNAVQAVKGQTKRGCILEVGTSHTDDCAYEADE